MFQDILDKLINNAENMMNDINKNRLDIDDILLNDLYCFSNITIDKIENIKKNHIDNMNIFLNYHSISSIFDINDTTFEQLNDILNDNNLQLFKIKKLMKKDIQTYLIKSEDFIKNEIKNSLNNLNMFDKIDFYYEIYKNDNVKEYFNMIQNKNQSEDIIDNDFINFVDFNINDEEFEEIFCNILENLNEKLNYKKINSSDMYWDDNVILYKFFNTKTYEYIYIYFDLFKRKDKVESKNIIKLKDNIYCINTHYTNVSDINFENLENYIDVIIKQLLD
jgi:hypothetical protein